MIRVLAILCFVAAPALGIWEKGWLRTYSVNALTWGKSSFVPMPTNITQAEEDNWINVTGPTLPSGYESLSLYCLTEDYVLGIFFDDTGYLAGVQVAIDPNKVSDTIFDWKKAGFTNWTTTCNGTNVTYYTTQVFFSSPDFLAKSTASRIAARDEDYILQDDYYYVKGFNGELISVPVNQTELESTMYTSQACMIGMGNHWYYNMSSALTCSVDTIATWFHYGYNDQSAGVAFSLPGKYTPGDGLDIFETPSKTAIELIVPRAPDCYYNYGDDPGMITLHFYFFKNPYYITCIW